MHRRLALTIAATFIASCASSASLTRPDQTPAELDDESSVDEEDEEDEPLESAGSDEYVDPFEDPRCSYAEVTDLLTCNLTSREECEEVNARLPDVRKFDCSDKPTKSDLEPENAKRITEERRVEAQRADEARQRLEKAEAEREQRRTSRLWACQEAASRGDLDGTLSCWRQPASHGDPPWPDREETIECLEKLPTQRQRIRYCAGLGWSTKKEAERKLQCIDEYRDQRETTCGPLVTTGILATFEAEVSLPEVEADLRSGWTSKAKAAEQQRQERCGATHATVMALKIQHGLFDPARAKGCEYGALFIVINQTRDGWTFAATGSAQDSPLAVYTSTRAHPPRSTIVGRARFLGMRKFQMVDGTYQFFPTFKLLDK